MGEMDEAVTQALEHAAQSRLNSVVAILVALAATCMALTNIKDGNIVQNMTQAQARTVDAWSYYQAKGTKQNIAEATYDQLVALKATTGGRANPELDKKIESYREQAIKFEKEKATIKADAEGYQKLYDALNLHDDQFDLSDAAFSVAIALLGVTALTQKRWLLGLAALFLAVGVIFGLAGFLEWSIHPDGVMSWLS